MSYFKQELIENPSLIVNIELNKEGTVLEAAWQAATA